MSGDAKKIGEKLLRNTRFGVENHGVDVVMVIGDKSVRMDFLTALRMSSFLRNAGRIAKQRAGAGRVVTAFADLTDANLDELKAQRNRDGTAVFGKVR